MIRHIFVAPVKPGTPDEFVDKKIAEMRGLETAVDGIEGFTLGRNIALIAPLDAVIMVIDLHDRDAFDALLSCQLHHDISAAAAETFDIEKFTFAQVEI